GATNGELEACLADGGVPLVWASGRRSAPDAAMAGTPSTPAPEAPSNLPVDREPRETVAETKRDSLADAIALAIQGKISAGIDEAQVKAIAREVFAEM